MRHLLGAVSSAAILAVAFTVPVQAQSMLFDIAAQPVRTGVLEFSRQSGVQILIAGDAAGDQWGTAVNGEMTPREAIERLLAGTDLVVRADDGRTLTLGRPQLGDAGPALQEIIVTGQRLAQVRALEEKRKATGVREVVSADDIGRLPDKNAAESVERLPGVSLQYDQGEGRYVAIRGIDASLNNVTVNGVGLGTPDGDSRAMPLDVVSGQLVSRIEVVKAVTPDMDGQALGGAVNLVTQSPFDQNKDFFGRVSVQGGHEDLNDKTPYAMGGTAGGVFGPDKSWGLLLGANYSWRDYRTYGMYPDDWREVKGFQRGLPLNLKDTVYDLERRRLGLNGALEYQPGDDDKFHLRGLYSKFWEDERRERYRLDFATDALVNGGKVTTSNGATGISTGAQQRVDLRLEQKEKAVATISAGAEHRRGDWIVDYDLAWVRDRLVEPNQVWTFRGGSVTSDINMEPLLFTVTPRADATPSQLAFNQLARQDNTGEQTAWVGSLNIRRDIAVGDNGSFLKAGAKYRRDSKSEDDNNDIYGAGSGSYKFTLANHDLAGPSLPVDLDDAVYQVSPSINIDAMRDFTAAHLGEPYFVRNAATSLANSLSTDYDVDEDILAFYAMGNLVFGDWTLTGGLRVEHTSIDASGYQLANGKTITPVSASHSYTDLLPNLHLRWEPGDGVVLRAAYTQTLGRPSYSSLAPASSFTYEGSSAAGYDGAVSTGNPALKPYKARNYDLAGEYYFAKGGLISGSLFYKDIADPIFGFQETLTNLSFSGLAFANLDFSQPRNASAAWIKGIELAWQQQFTDLPGPLGGLGAGLNVTFTDSEMDLPDGRSVAFPKQADKLYTAQLFYQKYGVEAALSYHFGGAYLNAVADSAAMDDYFNRYRRLDAKVRYDLTDHINVFAEAQNLLDEALWEYQGGRKDWVIGYERYGRTIYFGTALRW